MPWSTSNPPSAAGKYSDKCKRAFVHAANSTLEKTGDDGRAMAAGHAAAKQCEGKKAMDGLTTFNFELGTAERPLIASLDADSGKLRIEGTSSSTLRDGHGDEVTLKALEKMAKQAIGMTVWLNHHYEVPDDVFGTITKTRVIDSGERDKDTGYPIYDLTAGMEVEDINDAAVKTHRMIEKGRKLGISVGAMIPEEGVSKSQNGGRYVFDDVDLVEMSIVGVPANSRCWATVATKALNSEFVAKSRAKDEDEEVPFDVQPEPEVKSDASVLPPEQSGAVPDPSTSNPSAEAVDAALDTIDGETADEALGVDEAGEPADEPEKKSQKSRITVWDGDKTVQIDTGRTRKNGEDQSAQDDDSPESAGGLPSKKALAVGASSEMYLVRALRGNLDMAMRRITELEGERDAAYAAAADTVEKTAAFIDELGKTPMGKRAVFEDVKKSFDDDFTSFDHLTFLDPEVKRLLVRRSREPVEGSPTT